MILHLNKKQGFAWGVLALSLALCMPGCSSDKDEDPQEDKGQKVPELADQANSGCIDTRADGGETFETIVLQRDGGVIACQLRNYDANCGLERFDVNMRVVKADAGADSVLIDVTPVAPDTKDCYCPYNASFTLRNMPEDDFVLKCWWYEGLVSLKEGEPLTIENRTEVAAIDGLRYRLHHATRKATVEKGNCYSGELRIPSEVSYGGTLYNVTDISGSAFLSCHELVKVTIPATVRSTDYEAGNPWHKNPFFDCTALQAIEVEDGNAWLSASDGALFNKAMTRLFSYPAGSGRTAYSVPGTVTWIGANAFYGCSSLRTIDVPESVTFIGYGAFSQCNLDTLYIRGHLDEESFEISFLGDMSETATVYVPAADVEKVKRLFHGTVLPI